jgi:hypothetical protein
MNVIFDIVDRPQIFTKNVNLIESLSNVAATCYIGTFDKLYYFHDSWTKTQEDKLSSWLSLNCTKNFIFMKLNSTILAGGNVDNAYEWNTHKKKRRQQIDASDYFIKLYQSDVIMFEMVWLTKFLDNV